MRWVMRLVLVTLVLALGASVPAEARNQTIAPPGNSGVSQYLESVPTASGSRPTNTIKPGGGGSHRSGGVGASGGSGGSGGPGGIGGSGRSGGLSTSGGSGSSGGVGTSGGSGGSTWATTVRAGGRSSHRRSGVRSPRRAPTGWRSQRSRKRLPQAHRRTRLGEAEAHAARRLGGLDPSRILPGHRTRQGDDRFEQRRRAWTAAAGDPDHQPARRRRARARAPATGQLTPGSSCASPDWPSLPRCCSPGPAHHKLHAHGTDTLRGGRGRRNGPRQRHLVAGGPAHAPRWSRFGSVCARRNRARPEAWVAEVEGSARFEALRSGNIPLQVRSFASFARRRSEPDCHRCRLGCAGAGSVQGKARGAGLGSGRSVPLCRNHIGLG